MKLTLDTINLSADWLRQRFFESATQALLYPGEEAAIADYRGDHNLNPGMMPRVKSDGLMAASVLLPIVDRPEGLTLLLTKRADHLSNHPGQVSFPGGRAEPEDRDYRATALRETEEELGVAAHKVELIGRLDDYLTHTGFIVSPVVGIVQPPLELAPDPGEVAAAFEVPLTHLLDPQHHRRGEHVLEGKPRAFYVMDYNDYHIWGATAGMLINFYQLLMAAADPDH